MTESEIQSSRSLPPHQQQVAPGKWPVVGEKAPRQSEAAWTIALAGLVEMPRVWTLDALQTWSQHEFPVDIHCVTRWSKPGTMFRGFLLSTLLECSRPLPDARYISFVARSDRHHSTSLPLEEALALGTIVAFACDGEPLATEHGGPVRTVVPGRYFYKSLKWLERVELLAEDRLGYWEDEAGYHNHADPWQEERYITSDVDRRLIAQALATLDFAGRDWRGIDARGRSLPNLNASNALLRNANFQQVDLRNARFDGANLSNAHLEGANLRGASFVNADVEGANFRQANLRGADFSGASLFGATFTPEQENEAFGPAQLDATTQLHPKQLEALTPVQQRFLSPYAYDAS